MNVRWLLLMCLALGLTVSLAPRGRADDEDEPTFLDKKLTYWLSQAAEGKEAKERIRGLLGVEQIGHAGSRRCVPALAKALREDKEEAVRARAARALGRTIAKAMQQARDDKKEELPRFDGQRDDLINALRTEKSDAVKEAVATAVGDVGADFRAAAGALGLALKEKHPGTVTAAATALRRMGRDAKEAETELIALAGSADAPAEARIDAVLALGQLRADVPAALPTLKAVLADPKVDAGPIKPDDPADEKKRKREQTAKAARLRQAAAEAMGKWGRDSADAAGTLASALTEKGAPTELRMAALVSIDQIGPDGKAAVPGLVKAVGDDDRFVRCLAMQTVAKMGEVLEGERQPAVNAILKATEDSILEVAVTAVEALGALGTSGGVGDADSKARVLKRFDDVEKRDGRKVLRDAVAAARPKLTPKK